jgi:hypothetical protein
MPLVPTDRVPPHVPNHEMLRVIGRGAYGQIWLARSVTGTLRAIKIVDRRTFESEKAFQREFEGMARFEPISRSDAGFVDILHVGRDPGGDFFYYVMELADDHVGGARVDPEQYVPKTLKTELARRGRLLADECLNLGLSLTRALGALHQQGLVHRDIKPANIIFVGGTPKIADIGLVAASGQDSFVGTEGYVPPEGPGTAQADLYSLGKVLYEIAMGKDRLDFPAVHTRLDQLPDKAGLMQLNAVLLRACANDPADRYATAQEMHGDLERVRDGRALAPRHRRRRTWLAAAVAAIICATLLFFALRKKNAPMESVTIATDPVGAMVVIDGTMKRSPARFALRPGSHAARVMLGGYDPVQRTLEVEAGAGQGFTQIALLRSVGSAQISSEPENAAFALVAEDEVIECGTTPARVANVPVGEYQLAIGLRGRLRTEPMSIKREETTRAEVRFPFSKVDITSEPAGAQITVDGVAAGAAPVTTSVMEGDHEIRARYRSWPEQRRDFRAENGASGNVSFEFPRGSAKITSAPGGAAVFDKGGVEKGRTPLHLDDLEPGPVEYELRLAGYKPIALSGTVAPGEQTFLGARFLQRAGPRRGEPWENSLGMKFLPVGNLLVAVWPARVRDYAAFCSATGRSRQAPDFPQDDTHPVVKVSWEDANAFCDWLTKKENDEGNLEEGQQYRLPTDAEWSMAAGLPDEGGATPEERDGKLRDFPWGKQWPPPNGAGNYADAALRRSGVPVIAGFHDGFAQTSPVGSFPPNRAGLRDMGGNVWEWCLDGYKGSGRFKDWGVLRGGSWANAAPAELRASYRNVVDRTERDVIYGFRCVIEIEPAR